MEFNEQDEDEFDEEEESKFCTLPRSNNGFTIRHVSALTRLFLAFSFLRSLIFSVKTSIIKSIEENNSFLIKLSRSLSIVENGSYLNRI